MKILMVISQFNPIIGGAEKQAQLLAKKLNEKGVGVNLITGWWKFGTPRKEMIDGIKVFRNFCFWGMFGIETNRMIRMFGGILYVISLGTYLFLHGREYDIIHVHQFLYPAFVCALIGRKILKKPVLVKSASSGGTSDLKLLRQVPLGSRQLDFLLKEVEFLVAVSKATANDFKEIGYSESRISHIPNGVEIPIAGKTNYNRVIQIATVTRLSQEKGVDVLLRSWAEVVGEIGNLKLLIVGDGPLESQLKALSCSLGIAESVDFVGKVEDAFKFLEATDLFVLSSRSEGMSNALLEAMSYGIPCIATQAGGNRELLGAENEEISRGGYVLAKNGLLINPDDVRGLTEAILFFIRNRHKREEMGRRGRHYIEENHSIDSVAERYIALYQSLLNKRC